MSLVAVTGLPGAGKTTIGKALAAVLDVPFVDKDDCLDELLDGSPSPSTDRPALSRRADTAFIERAKQNPGAVLVSFWRRPELSTTSGTPTEWLAATSDPVELWCRCPPEIAVARFIARRRHPGHGDDTRNSDELLEQFEAYERLGPVGVGRLVSVDTSGYPDVAMLAERVRDPESDER